MTERTVLLSFAGPVATLTLNRPDALNAISLEMVEDLNAALNEIAAAPTPARCVVLTGAGRAFCAGGDITVHRDRPADTPPYDLGEVVERHFNPLLMRLMTFPAPLLTAVNGAAVGAGCPLALCADIVIASQRAYFECGFTRLGLIPDLGATWLLPRLIGRARAHTMMLLNQRVGAEEAQHWGMIHRCVSPEELQPVVVDAASNLCATSMPAFRATRSAIKEALGGSLDKALKHEAHVQQGLGHSRDFAEGIAAFFARRPPAFDEP